MNKKIVVIGNNDIGLYNFRKELLERLCYLGNEVHILLPFGERVKDLEEIGCIYHEVSMNSRGTNPIEDLKLFMDYKRNLKCIDPSFVLTYTIKPNIYGGLAASILKLNYMANITGLGSAVENEGILQNVTVNLYKLSLKNAKCVFFQNEENYDFFINHNITKAKKKLLPGSGVNLNKYNVLDYPTQGTIKFLFIARIMKEKGIDEYIFAAEEISKKYNNVEFWIVGTSTKEYDKKLKKLDKKKVLRYFGYQRDITTFLEKCHCTVHPSYYPEGMSNVCLESAACGRPVITTDRSGCREIVEDGITGYIVKKKDVKDLVQKIEKFISLPYESKKKMGLLGREKIEREFNRDIVINAYLDELG